ncbi:unnamed protein product, partial [Rotaria magnacalcarata]
GPGPGPDPENLEPDGLYHQGSSWSREQQLIGKQKKIFSHSNAIHFFSNSSTANFIQQLNPSEHKCNNKYFQFTNKLF